MDWVGLPLRPRRSFAGVGLPSGEEGVCISSCNEEKCFLSGHVCMFSPEERVCGTSQMPLKTLRWPVAPVLGGSLWPPGLLAGPCCVWSSRWVRPRVPDTCWVATAHSQPFPSPWGPSHCEVRHRGRACRGPDQNEPSDVCSLPWGPPGTGFRLGSPHYLQMNVLTWGQRAGPTLGGTACWGHTLLSVSKTN